jgi:hypothetical protein
MHVEAMNFSGMGHAAYAAGSIFRSMRCAYGAIASKNPPTIAASIRMPGLN